MGVTLPDIVGVMDVRGKDVPSSSSRTVGTKVPPAAPPPLWSAWCSWPWRKEFVCCRRRSAVVGVAAVGDAETLPAVPTPAVPMLTETRGEVITELGPTPATSGASARVTREGGTGVGGGMRARKEQKRRRKRRRKNDFYHGRHDLANVRHGKDEWDSSGSGGIGRKRM